MILTTFYRSTRLVCRRRLPEDVRVVEGAKFKQYVRLSSSLTPEAAENRVKSIDGDEGGNQHCERDPNGIWREWFQSHEYQPIWSSSSLYSKNENQGISDSSTNFHIQPLTDPQLDKISRDLLSRLDDILHCTTRSIDIPTTQECNRILDQLDEVSKTDRNENGTTDGSLSHRAYLILKKMHLCYDVRTDLPHKHFTYTAPKPNRETYISALKLHVNDAANGAPQRALDIVQNMKERSTLYGDWDASVTVLFWNQVIASWANSSQPNKSYEAANVLKNHMCHKGGDEASTIADISSYGHVFKACATSHKMGSRERTLAGKVALTCWKDLNSSPLFQLENGSEKVDKSLMNRGSIAIMFALTASNMIENEKVRNEAIQSQFDTARRLGLVNAHVLSAFQTVGSEKVINDTLGKFGTNNSAANLFAIIPKEWKRNCRRN